MKLLVKKAKTSKLLHLFIQDSSSGTGAGLTGLTNASGSLTAYYWREGASAAVAISLASGTLGTWSSGGFKEMDATNMPGWYEFGIPDAALATGAESVKVLFKGAANMAPVPMEIQLVDFDPHDTVRLGLTALPNAVAAATGGVPTVDANNAVKVQSGTGSNQISLSSGAVVLQSGTGTGQLDITSGVVKANATQFAGQTITAAAGVTLPSSVASPTNITAGTITTVTNLTNAPTSGDFTTTMKTSLNAATPAVTVSDKTGFSLSTAGVQAIWDALTSAMVTVGSIGKRLVDNIDAAISSRSTYAGGDTSGTTTLLSRLTSTRATNLDNLDAAVSSRSSHSAADVWSAGTRTLTSFGTLVTDIWAAGTRTLTGFGTLVADVWAYATRTITSGGITAAEIWNHLTSAITTSGSVGKQIKDNLDAAVSSRSSHTADDVWSVATRTLTGFGTLIEDIWSYATRTITSGGITASEIWSHVTRTLTSTGGATAADIWDYLTSAITTSGSIGKQIKDNLDDAVSSRLADDDYVSPDNGGISTIKVKTDQLTFLSAGVVSATVDQSALDDIAAQVSEDINENVWSAPVRSLTQSAVQVATIVSGDDITVLRGDKWTIALTGIGSLAGRTKLWFTVKANRSDPDSASIMQVVENNGLVILNGNAIDETEDEDDEAENGDASITVNDEGNGDITLTVNGAATSLIDDQEAVYDVQMLNADGEPVTRVSGAFRVTADVTRSTE